MWNLNKWKRDLAGRSLYGHRCEYEEKFAASRQTAQQLHDGGSEARRRVLKLPIESHIRTDRWRALKLEIIDSDDSQAWLPALICNA